jgi:hypothetical protein
LLVGCCVFSLSFGHKANSPPISLIFCCPNHHPNDGTTSPHGLHPPRALSPTSLLPLLSIAGWLLRVFIKFWPYDQLPSHLSFFVVVPIVTQTMGRHPPMRSTPQAPSLQHLSYRCCRLPVSCCVFSLSFGHKANSPPISLIFDGSLYGAPNRGTNRALSPFPNLEMQHDGKEC